ncbi:MAG: DHH family phosphoesterase [Candidatus Uhrbacteria bacterium]
MTTTAKSANSTMTQQTMYRAFWGRLRDARDILLVSPKCPDGDSVGSICALREALALIGKAAVMFCPDDIPAAFRLLPRSHEIICDRKALTGRTFDTIVVVDAGDLDFAGIENDLPLWRRPGSQLLVVDHHATNEGYGDLNCIVPTASSTTQILTAIFRENDVPITAMVSTCLLFGLVTDTDGFTNPAATAAALATAADLTASGARLAPIISAAFCGKSIVALRVWGRALERLRLHPQWSVAVTVLIPDDFVELEDIDAADGISNFLQAVLPVRAILVLKDRGDGLVRGSLRTQLDDVDVGAVAAFFGGGGHRKASGFGMPGRLVQEGESWKVV